VSQAPSLRQNTFWAACGQISIITLQTIYFILVSRMLGSYEYGLFVGIYSLVAVLSPYSALGFGMIMLRDASRDPGRLARAWGMSLTMLAGGTVAVMAIAAVSSHFLFHGNLVLIVLCIAFSDAFCTRAIELAGQAFQARHLLAWTARMNALMGLTRTLAAAFLALYCWHTHVRASVELWTFAYTAFSIVGVTVALLIVHIRLVKPEWGRMTRRDLSEGLSFSLSSSSYSIYNDIDKTMLASYGFIQAAGTYAAAYRIIEIATAPIRAVYAAALPRIFQYGAEGRGKVVWFSRYLLKWTGLYGAVACAGLIWAAPWFPLVVGKSFAGSVSAIRILALLPLLRCFHYSAGNAISGCASQWYRTSAQLFAALLNLVLNLLLIPRWSWQGAAVASLITDGSLGAINWATLLYLRARSRREVAPIAEPATASV
jgi:O-antigen/teichoic acid export membrane protein